MPSAQTYPGQRLGLPQSGSDSLAGFWRRLLALLIDWALASFISWALFGFDNVATLVTFALCQWLFIATAGFSVGHRVMGLRVRRLDAQWVGFWRSLIRIGLILLVLPPTIWDADGRGLHDKAAGTVLVRR